MPDINHKLITKSEFAQKLGISASTRSRWLNQRYYNEILQLGYDKKSHLLNAKVVDYLFRKLVYIEN